MPRVQGETNITTTEDVGLQNYIKNPKKFGKKKHRQPNIEKLAADATTTVDAMKKALSDIPASKSVKKTNESTPIRRSARLSLAAGKQDTESTPRSSSTEKFTNASTDPQDSDVNSTSSSCWSPLFREQHLFKSPAVNLDSILEDDVNFDDFSETNSTHDLKNNGHENLEIPDQHTNVSTTDGDLVETDSQNGSNVKSYDHKLDLPEKRQRSRFSEPPQLKQQKLSPPSDKMPQFVQTDLTTAMRESMLDYIKSDLKKIAKKSNKQSNFEEIAIEANTTVETLYSALSDIEASKSVIRTKESSGPRRSARLSSAAGKQDAMRSFRSRSVEKLNAASTDTLDDDANSTSSSCCLPTFQEGCLLHSLTANMDYKNVDIRSETNSIYSIQDSKNDVHENFEIMDQDATISTTDGDLVDTDSQSVPNIKLYDHESDLPEKRQRSGFSEPPQIKQKKMLPPSVKMPQTEINTPTAGNIINHRTKFEKKKTQQPNIEQLNLAVTIQKGNSAERLATLISPAFENITLAVAKLPRPIQATIEDKFGDIVAEAIHDMLQVLYEL